MPRKEGGQHHSPRASLSHPQTKALSPFWCPPTVPHPRAPCWAWPDHPLPLLTQTLLFVIPALLMLLHCPKPRLKRQPRPLPAQAAQPAWQRPPQQLLLLRAAGAQPGSAGGAPCRCPSACSRWCLCTAAASGTAQRMRGAQGPGGRSSAAAGPWPAQDLGLRLRLRQAGKGGAVGWFVRAHEVAVWDMVGRRLACRVGNPPCRHGVHEHTVPPATLLTLLLTEGHAGACHQPQCPLPSIQRSSGPSSQAPQLKRAQAHPPQQMAQLGMQLDASRHGGHEPAGGQN